jgi:hypothetical protein
MVEKRREVWEYLEAYLGARCRKMEGAGVEVVVVVEMLSLSRR